MHAESYKTRSGRTLFRPVLDDGESIYSFDCQGFCLGCGQDAFGVEPDARHYPCESCGERLVYGLEELALMGLLSVGDLEEVE